MKRLSCELLKKMKGIGAVLIAISLVLGSINIGRISIKAEGETPLPVALKAGMSIQYDIEGNGNWVKANNSDNIDIGDRTELPIRIHFDWSNLNGTRDILTNYVQAGTKYEIPIPSKLDVSGMLNSVFLPRKEKGGEGEENRLGTLTKEKQADGTWKLFVEFASGALSDNDTNMGFQGKISLKKADAKPDGSEEIELGDGIKVTVKSSSNVAQDAIITKTVAAKVNMDGTVEWTINYTPADPNSTTEKKIATLTDTLPAEMEFVAESVTPSTLSPDTTEAGKVKFDVSDLTETTTIKYKTKITDAELAKVLANNGTARADYTNSVQGKNSEGTDVGDPVTAKTLKPDPVNPGFTKAYAGYDSTNKRVKWRIEVDTKGVSLSELIVTDTLGAWLQDEGDGSKYVYDVQINNKNVKELASADNKIEVIDNKFTYNLVGKYDNNDNLIGVDSKNKYVFTYSTPLNQNYFNNPDTEKPIGALDNQATLDWKLNITSGTQKSTDAITIGPEILSRSFIAKEAKGTSASADGKGIVFTYNIVVNPNRLSMSTTDKYFVEDLLNDAFKLDSEATESRIDYYLYEMPTLVEGTDNTDTGISMKTKISTDDVTHLSEVQSGIESDSVMVVTPQTKAETTKYKGFISQLIGLDKKKATIQVKVVCYDNRITLDENVSNRGITNIATLYRNNNKQADASATQGFESKFSAKNITSYNPITQEIEWRLSINQHGVSCAHGIVTVEDILPKGVTYVSSKYSKHQMGTGYTVQDKTVVTSSGDEVIKEFSAEDTDNGQKLTYKVDVSDGCRYDIHVITKVDFENVDVSAIQSDGKTKLTNRFTASTEDGLKVPEKQSTITFPKKDMVDKVYERLEGTNKLNYEVYLNPEKKDIVVSDKTLSMEDVLSEALILDTSSIEVYKGKLEYSAESSISNGVVAATKMVPDGEKLTLSDDAWSYGPNPAEPGTTKLKIELPVETGVTNPSYLVRYSAVVTKPGEAINKVKLTNSSKDATTPSDVATFMFEASAYSSSRKLAIPGMSSLNIKKVNENNAELSYTNIDDAAKFEIYRKNTGTSEDKIGEIVCNPSNVVYLDNTLVAGLDSIFIKEVKAPATKNSKTYTPIEGLIEVPITWLDKEEAVPVVNVSNGSTPIPTNLKVTKVDENDAYLPGATVGLYSDEGCENVAKDIDGVDIAPKVIDNASGVTFEKLELGKFYYLKETVKPEGYIHVDPIKILAGTNKEIKVINRKATTLTLKKVDAHDGTTFVPGAKVTIFSDADETIIEMGTVGTETTPRELKDIEIPEEGVVLHLEARPYWIKETPPEGYQGVNGELVNVPTAGTTHSIQNSKLSKQLITKVDASNEERLAGAKVSIYTDNGANAPSTTLAYGRVGSSTSNDMDLENIEIPKTGEGLSVYLPEGKYWIVETVAPSNYKRLANPVSFTVVYNTEGQLIKLENSKQSKKPSPTNTPTNSEDSSSDDSTPAPTPTVAPVQGKIPQTGQPWLPAMVMGGLGIIFLAIGFLWKPKREDD